MGNVLYLCYVNGTLVADETGHTRRRLKELRARLRLTQADLARAIGVTVTSVNRWENGQAEPSLATLRRIDRFERERLSAPPAVAAGRADEAGGGSDQSNFPVYRTSFIDRERELMDVLRALERPGLVTVTGTGGCGKTRFAVHAARACAENYPDGKWFIDLSPIADATLLPRAVASAVRAPVRVGADDFVSMTAFLGSRAALLVLDNCEHLVDGCAAAVDRLLALCSHLTVLATSREPLRVEGETVFPLPPLAVPTDDSGSPETMSVSAAVELFLQRACARDPAFATTNQNARAIARLCRRLDGIPLAIELAAARTGILSVQQIVDRLDDRFALLTGGGRTAAPRHQTLLAAISWSYDLLPEAEQLLFERLAVFSGGFGVDAVEALALEPGEDARVREALDLLGQLVAKSLVVRERGEGAARYRLLETVREYAYRRLRDRGGADDAQRRHAEYQLAVVARADLEGPDQVRWLALLDEDLGNIRAVLRWCLAQPSARDRETGLSIAEALRRFWMVRGHATEGRRWLEQAMAGGQTAPVPMRARALLALGSIAIHQSDLTSAIAACEEGLSLARETGDPRLMARALYNLGVATSRSDPVTARRLHEESLALSRDVGDIAGVSRALNGLGSAALYQADYETARSLLQQAIPASRAAGETYGLAIALGLLGFLALAGGSLREAAQLTDESLRICVQLGASQDIAFLLAARGALVSSTNPNVAVRLLGASEAQREALGTPLYPAFVPFHEQVVAAARAVLDDVTFQTEWSAGRALSMQEAADIALTRPPGEADSVSAERSERSPAPPTVRLTDADSLPAGLTQREAQVLQLLASGHSNKQIGNALVLSARTVERHIANIYGKIGAHGRADATAFALRSRLSQRV